MNRKNELPTINYRQTTMSSILASILFLQLAVLSILGLAVIIKYLLRSLLG